MTVAVVLGAGGSSGWGFHLGVARALETELDLRVVDADLVVGTSAGAAIGTSLKAGAAVEELRAGGTTPPTDEERAEIRAQTGTDRSGLARFRPLSPTLALRGLVDPRRAGLVMAGGLPGGAFATMALSRFPRIDETLDWPEGLWLPAVRVADGEVVVFGRDERATPPKHALEASSAVPGMFRPKEIDGHLFVDGATASANHAHLAAEVAPDLVVVSSVQTRPGLRASRVLARRQLPAEVKALEAVGATVVVVEPDEAIATSLTGFPRATGERSPEIVDQVAEYAARRLASIDR